MNFKNGTENSINSTNSSGYWGAQTATIDWCELNYEVTYYIAEFWNTVSSLIMVILPIFGIIWYYKFSKMYEKESIQLKTKFSLSISIVWCYLGLMLVGIGSMMFHMSLLYKYQLLDELPMVLASGILVYANYSILVSIPREDNTSFYSKLFNQKWLVILTITTYCSAVTYIYVYVNTDPVFHEVCYGVMVTIIIIENILIMRKLDMPGHLYALQIFYYLFGFFLWNIDNKFCYYLRAYRNELNVYFDLEHNKSAFIYMLVVCMRAISELHAFWHLFTGYSTYLSILSLKRAHYHNLVKIEEFKHSHNETRLNFIDPLESKCFKLYYYLRSLDDFDIIQKNK